MWQRASDFEASSLSPDPDPAQIRAARDSTTGPPSRGIYYHFMVITNPSPHLTFRLVYPRLAVSSLSTNTVYIWDLPTATIIQTLPLDISNDDSSLFDEWQHRPHMVEINTDHVFLCGSKRLRVYSLSSGDIVFELQSSIPSHKTPHSLSIASITQLYKMGDPIVPPMARQGQYSLPPRIESWCLMPGNIYLKPSLVGPAHVRISPSGKDLVVATLLGWIFYIPDFADTKGLEDCTRAIYIPESVVQIEFDGKRIIFCSVSLNSSHSICSMNNPCRYRPTTCSL